MTSPDPTQLPVRPFTVDETHRIALSASNRLLWHSADLGWDNVYASVAVEDPWHADLPVARHNCVAFCLNRPARIERSIDGGGASLVRTLAPRQFGVIPSGVTSTWDVRGSPEMMLIYLRDSLLQSVAEEVFDIDPRSMEVVPRLGECDPLLEQLAMSLLDVLREQQPGSGLYVDSLAHMMAVQLVKRHVARPPQSSGTDRTDIAPRRLGSLRMARLREFIDSCLDEKLDLERLAAEAGLTPYRFVEAFTREFGTSPHRFVLSRRVERARHLLRSSDDSLIAIALQCGFASQSHLSTTFVKSVGVTPGAYRKGST